MSGDRLQSRSIQQPEDYRSRLLLELVPAPELPQNGRIKFCCPLSSSYDALVCIPQPTTVPPLGATSEVDVPQASDSLTALPPAPSHFNLRGEGMSEPVVPVEMREQAADLWRYLDQLADSDPDAYKTFISQQLQQRKSPSAQPPRPPPLFLPSPVFTLQTQQTRPTATPVYVNVCQSTQVQPILLQSKQPASDDDIRVMSGLLIPLSVGKPRQTTSSTTEPVSEEDRRGGFDYDCLRALAATQPATSLPTVANGSVRCDVYDVVLHPHTLHHASHSLPLLLAVLQLAWQHIQQDNPPCTLHTQYRPVPGVRYIGDRTPQQTEQHPSQSTKTPLAPQPQPIVLPSRTALAEQKQQEEVGAVDTLTELRTAKPTTAAPRAGAVLIEEVDEPRRQPVWEERYEAGRLCASVQLPGVDSMAELSVEMGGRQLVVTGGVYELSVQLQREVLEDTCTVKWSRKKHVLSITAALKG